MVLLDHRLDCGFADFRLVCRSDRLTVCSFTACRSVALMACQSDNLSASQSFCRFNDLSVFGSINRKFCELGPDDMMFLQSDSCQSIDLSVFIFSQAICRSVGLSVCRTVCPSIIFFVFVFVFPYAWLCQYACLFVCLSFAISAYVTWLPDSAFL